MQDIMSRTWSPSYAALPMDLRRELQHKKRFIQSVSRTKPKPEEG